MVRAANDILISFGGLLFVLGMLVTMLFAGFMPLMAWSAMRSLKQIRGEFERLNATLESKVTITKSGPLGL